MTEILLHFFLRWVKPVKPRRKTWFRVQHSYLVAHPANRKWVIDPVINGISRVNPLITGVITHLLSGMSHQVGFQPYKYPWFLFPRSSFRRSGSQNLRTTTKPYIRPSTGLYVCGQHTPTSRHVRVHVAVHVAVHVRDHVKDMAHNKPK